MGKFVTWFPDPVYTMEDLVSQLKSGRCKPAVWEENGYRIVDDFNDFKGEGSIMKKKLAGIIICGIPGSRKPDRMRRI